MANWQVLRTPEQAGSLFTSRRKARKLTQRELASQLGISQNRLSDLERTPKDWTLERMLIMAQTLGLELVLQDRSEPSRPSRSTPEW